MSPEIKVKVGGPAGAGVMTLGMLFAKLFQRHKLYTFFCNDYPSLIRGGHNIAYVRANSSPVYAKRKGINLLVALDENSVKIHNNDLLEGGAVIYDKDIVKVNEGLKRENVNYIPSPLYEIANSLGNRAYSNTVAFGIGAKLLGVKDEKIEEAVRARFKGKKEEIIEGNIKAALEGAKWASNLGMEIMSLEEGPLENSILLNGNDAAAIGAIKAGLKYLGQYPMTPASSILHFIAKYEIDKRIVVKQTEDELAAMNSIIGAAFAGARAMTATSGGGFSLMTEALGMAGLSETPIVVIESQRAGPSTGMPTYTEQGDLRFVMHASQGEFPRVVMAPGDVEETFYMVFEAFNIAERLQLPVIVLLDKFLSTSAMAVKRFDTSKLKIDRGKLLSYEDCEKIKEGEYKRYKLEEDGISPRALPSYPNCMHVAGSYEHDETGFTTEEIEMRNKQVEKRNKKLSNLKPEEYAPNIFKNYGDGESEINLICWGSMKLPCLEALNMLTQEGIKAKMVHYRFIVPFPFEATINELSNGVNLVIENNSLAQFRGVIREQTGIWIENTLLRYDGRQMEPEQIVEKVKTLIRK